MKNVAITGPRTCELRDVAEPRAAGDYALIDIKVVPICTEFHQYEQGHPWWRDLGHEATGIVRQAAPNGRIPAGTRVVVMPQNGCGICDLCRIGDHCRCASPRDPAAITGVETGRACYAKRMVQQDWLLLPLPDDISLRHGSMAGCGLGPTFAAAHAMNVGPMDTLLISGLGPVGLGGVINGVTRGARVIGLDSNPYRMALAQELGAAAVLDPREPDVIEQVRALTGGQGADKSIECSSAEAAPATLLQATRVRGEMASVGWGGPVRMADVVRRGVTVRGFWHWNHLQDAAAMFWTIRQARPLLDQLITHEFPLDQVQEAWELQRTGQCGKVLLLPDGDPDAARG
jgi:threonine dehydrogenase-like Zn-dependent dehydrogenase